MAEKTALRVLKALFVALFVINIVVRILNVMGSAAGDVWLGMVFGLLIMSAAWATAYHFIANGSWIARLLTTLAGAFTFVSSLLQVSAYASRASFLDLLITVCSMALVAMIVTLINIQPIRGLKPRVPVPKPLPAGDSGHEHNWQPHSVLDDWVRCSVCGQMHLQPGTVALVNQAGS